MHEEKTFSIDLPPDKVMNAMRDPVLIDKSERSRDALRVDVKDLEKTDTVHKYDIFMENYARTIKGIDKNKIEKNRTTVTWDITKREGSWIHYHNHGSRVNVAGGYKVKPISDNKCELTMYVNIEIRIPVVGKLVSKKVQQAFKSEWPKYIERLTNHARTAIA